MLRTILLTILINLVVVCSGFAQSEPDARVDYLAKQILDKIPELECTAAALGRHEQRPIMARKHAQAIVKASDKYAKRWEVFAETANWKYFNVRTDLPALVASITYRESSFKSVIRNDDNSISVTVPATLMHQPRAFDAGVMQVRVPSAPGRTCGVSGKKDIHRLLSDLDFAYDVGTCILTNHISWYIKKYKEQTMLKLRKGERPDKDLQFFGVIGDRKDTKEALRARELLVIERYNWGDANLYNKGIGAGYARRVLTMFEYFRPPDVEPEPLTAAL